MAQKSAEFRCAEPPPDDAAPPAFHRANRSHCGAGTRVRLADQNFRIPFPHPVQDVGLPERTSEIERQAVVIGLIALTD